MTISMVLQAFLTLLGMYVLYVIVASSLPCLPAFQRKQTDENPFDAIDYYGGDAEGPDRIALLDTPVEGLGFRLELFANVQETLDVVCHTIHSGPTTSAFFSGILRAAERGVKVRILLDGKASSIRPSVLTMMRALGEHPNVECRRYNPIHPLKPWNWHFLMHDKYIIADGRYLLLGGRNIGDKFFAPDDYSGKISNDRDVVVTCQDEARAKESVVQQAGRYFESMWSLRESALLGLNRATRRIGGGIRLALHAEADTFAQRNPAYFETTFDQFLARAVHTRKITFMHNPSHVSRKTPWIWQQLHRVAVQAKSSVMLQTPYITANDGILTGLRSIAERVPLSILTNSAASTPNYPAYSNYYAQRRKFIKTGASIFEYQNAHSIHGKAMVVDRRLGIVGSFNLDDRSMFLDTEVMLAVDGEEFAEMLVDSIHAYQVQSLCVGEGNCYTAEPEGCLEARVPVYKVPLLRVVSVFSVALRSFI